MKLLILNGPNLNLLGKREPEIYGNIPFSEYLIELQNTYPDIELYTYQSNHEGQLIDVIQQTEGNYDGVIFNAGGYTHTSIALHDAILSVNVPFIEVHISNIAKREEYRHTSYISSAAIGSIIGLGYRVYRLGIEYFKDLYLDYTSGEYNCPTNTIHSKEDNTNTNYNNKENN